MSITKIQKAAGEHTDDYVQVSAGDLATALAEAGVKPERGNIAEHAQQVAKRDANAVMRVHRTHHLSGILGVKGSGTTTPAKPAVEAAK